MAAEPLIAVFVDFENLAIGARKSRLGAFRIDLVLKRNARLIPVQLDLLSSGTDSDADPI